MANIAYLRWSWERDAPLHTGYSQSLATYTGRIKKGERASINLETHTREGQLEPAFLTSSVKGVFRSASAWLVERVARELAEEKFITCDYAQALPGWAKDRVHVPKKDLCPVCQVYGGSGCLVEEARKKVGKPSPRLKSPVSFNFNDRNDALHAQTEMSEGYVFAWQVVENKGRELKAQQLQVGPGQVTLEARVDSADKFRLAVLLLSADLISAGFFRFGRFTTRGYGVVRLQPQAYFFDKLDRLLDKEGDPCDPLPTGLTGRQAGRQILNKDPIGVVRDGIRAYL